MTNGINWILFNAFVLVMLALDLGVFHRKAHTVKFKEALTWTGVWIALAMVFNGILYLTMGKEPALEFMTGYLIEKSLSVDNIFVFLLIFSYFKIPSVFQHKILFWGILGALVMRAIFIFAGVALIERFHWIIYVFGGFLIWTGLKMAFQKDKELHPEQNSLLKWITRVIRIDHTDQSGHFFVKVSGHRAATTMFLTLIFVEVSDLIFAVDSIPAILAVSHDPFIVYTSNVFAILGLRSLYFALARFVEIFEYLHYGLAGVLCFVGFKMVISGYYKIPIAIALGAVASMLAISVIASIWKTRRDERREQARKRVA